MIDKFVRSYCVRKKDQVQNPPIHKLKELVFPRNSQIHFLSKDGNEIGITSTNPILNNMDKGKVISEFVTSYSVEKAGGFKRVTMDMKEPIRDYMRRNKGIADARFSKSDMLLDKNIIVSNYGLMEENVKYFNNPRQWWIRFQNYWGSVFKDVEDKVRSNRRNHFIIMNIPDVMPSVSQFRKFAEVENNQSIDKIANSERMLIAQFWLWFMDSPRCILPKDPNVTNRMYVIFTWHDQWLCFNLASIRTYMKTSSNPKGSWDTFRMQRNFVIMLLTMQFGLIDHMAFADEEGEEAHDAPLTEEEKYELQQDLKDDTLGVLSQDPVDSVKEKITQAFDTLEVDIAEKESIENVEAKRNKKADSLLDELEVVNANTVDNIQEASPNTEQQILKDDDGEAVKTISREQVLIDYQVYQPKELNIEEKFDEHLKDQVVKGSVTPQQMKRLEKLARRYKEIPDPKTGVSSLEVAAKIEIKDLIISKDEKITDKINMVNDESMLKSTLVSYNKKYISTVMHKDVYNSVLALQRRGIAVQNYSIKRVTQLGDDYEVHSVKLVPIDGEPSTVNFKVPVIDDHGVFQSRGIKMKMAIQRVDIPIRKIGPDEVALTSSMSKMFVERCQFVAYSRDQWLKSKLLELVGDQSGVKVSFGKVFKNDEDVPLAYSRFARSVKRIRFQDYDLNFDVSKLDSFFGDEVVKAFDPTRGTQILLGKGKDTLLILTKAGIVHECGIDNKDHKELGPLEEFIGLDTSSAPKDCADLIVVSKNIPLGFVLGYYVGLGNLLKTLDVKYQFIPKNTRTARLGKDSIEIKFSDGTLEIYDYDYKAQLVLQGFNRYHRFVKRYPMVEFDKKSVYGLVLNEVGLPARYERELRILRDMWVDPITEEELKRMSEPTDFVLLLLRAAELLEKDMHPEAMDRAYQRDRGYERISSMIYDELVKSIRAYESTPVRAKAKVTMNPEAVWMKLIGDETTAPIEESNPIHALKDIERVVYRGSGGRSSRTMNAENRKFSKNAIGVDSMVTVDNGDAGTVRYLSANPNYNSIRGTINVLDTFDQSVNSSCLGTSQLLAPALDLDD